MLLIQLLWLPGCKWCGFHEGYSEPPPEPLAANLTAKELIGHLNENTAKIHAWRSTNVKLQAKGLPFDLKGILAVQHPRSFRLIASALVGDVADFGSNNDHAWFWMRGGMFSQPENMKHVFTVKHEQLPLVQQSFPLPIQPDWLMESLGVIPLDAPNARLEPTHEHAPYYRIVSNEMFSDGRMISRIIDVDKKTGLMKTQRLRNQQGQEVAVVHLRNHRRDPASGAWLPHEIELNWPETKMSLTMQMNQIDVNPVNLPNNLWTIPDIKGHTPLDIGAQLASQMPTEPQQQYAPLPQIDRPLRKSASAGLTTDQNRFSGTPSQNATSRNSTSGSASLNAPPGGYTPLEEPPWANEQARSPQDSKTPPFPGS